jgi:hypothetical protein
MPLCLGKLPARLHAYQARLSKYLDYSQVPTPPQVFGHQGLISDWGMLANDQYGCCVWSGGEHETMLFFRMGGLEAPPFDNISTIQNYETTGFNPSDPSTDNGTDVVTAAQYRRDTGLVDAAGNRHKVQQFALVTPGDLDHVTKAAYIFGAVGVGIKFPDSAMEQFQNGQPWDVVRGSKIQGGHYVPLVGRNKYGNLLVITWGQIQEMTPEFAKAYMDEACAYIDVNVLQNNVSPEGYDLATLQADLNALT